MVIVTIYTVFVHPTGAVLLFSIHNQSAAFAFHGVLRRRPNVTFPVRVEHDRGLPRRLAGGSVNFVSDATVSIRALDPAALVQLGMPAPAISQR
jgi:hypothetical protein